MCEINLFEINLVQIGCIWTELWIYYPDTIIIFLCLVIDFRDSPYDVIKHILTEGDGCSADKKNIVRQRRQTHSFLLYLLQLRIIFTLHMGSDYIRVPILYICEPLFLNCEHDEVLSGWKVHAVTPNLRKGFLTSAWRHQRSFRLLLYL